MDVIPIDQASAAPIGVPSPERDQKDSMGQVSAEALAKRTWEFHKKGLQARRLRDLTCEKYLVHVDGEGDAQRLDVFNGTKLMPVPTITGASWTQDNQLRPILDNFVAHLTTQPYRFVVEYRQDRRSRQSALVDQAIINHEVRSQKWNMLMAEAKAMAAVAGFCPIHSMWRDDPGNDAFESILPGVQPGRIDSWVGNPFDHVFNAGSKKGSVHRQTFGRMLPASFVRSVFGRDDLEGTDTMPSASVFQQIVSKWNRVGGARHGYSELSTGQGHEELIRLVYDEMLPGYDPEYPEGCLVIIAVNNGSRTGDQRDGVGKPTLLWKGPLPAQVFSSINVYSHHRFDDVHGKPYIGDIDDDQVELNQRLVLFKEYQRRANRPPIGGSGAVDVDTVGFERDTFFEVDGGVSSGSATLQWLEYPASHVPALLQDIQQIYERMYRKAGWQAASRGEAIDGSGKKVIALQQADDSIMGPISQRTSEELEDLAQLNWRLRKEFMDVPTALEYVGDELAHMVEPYVDRTKMSERPPRFRLVSGFGTSTEAKAQQLLNLLGATDAAGVPILTAAQFKKQWPDQGLYAEMDDPRDVQERRPRIVNEMIRQTAEQYVEQMAGQIPGWQPSMADPYTDQLGRIVEMEVAQTEDVLIDDDMELNISVLSIITQDPTEDPVARRAAMHRQMRYIMWMNNQQMAAQAAAAPPGEQPPAQGENGSRPGVPRRPNAQTAFNPAREGGTPNAESMVQADRQFSRETA